MPKNFGPCPLGVNSGKWGKQERPVSTPCGRSTRPDNSTTIVLAICPHLRLGTGCGSHSGR